MGCCGGVLVGEREGWAEVGVAEGIEAGGFEGVEGEGVVAGEEV